jgi:3-phenylpropionate/cinnamic acid dioxygenase small subunit
VAVSQADLERLLLQREIEEFLHAEAELLDERQFEKWLDLMAEDLEYVMPLCRNVALGAHQRSEDTSQNDEVCWFDDDKETLAKRVAQILTGQHWAEEPLSRMCHLISNVQIIETAPPEVHVKCRFLIYRNRLQDEENLFVGKRQDVLRKVGDGWKVAKRKILLDQNVLLPKNLTIFF